jgi:DNA primase
MEFVKKDIVREILERVDILEVISEYVSLKKVGKDWYGLCPFHPDTKPSMRVREDKKVFNCFGCGTGGNVITFISKIKNLSFQEALNFLAERYYPDLVVDISRESWSEKRKIIQANAHMLFLFRKFFKSKDGEVAREYLKSRKIKEDMWDHFAIGFAPSDPFIIPNMLVKEGFEPEILTLTGNIRKVENSLTLIFRKKIIFPITNTKGEVIAFGGRVLDDTASPKYINSAESPVFKKRESFFGLVQALDEMRLYGKCIIAEGYFDVISLHQAGLKYSISCLGTAITPSHISFLKKLATDIIFMFDGDDAGRKASLKNLEVFLKAGIIPKVCVLPQGEDPDSFISKGGNVQELEVKDGVIFASELLLLPALQSKDNVQLARAISHVQELISIIFYESQTQAEIYIRQICEKAGISPSTFRADVRKLAKPVISKKRELNIPEYELEILRFALNKEESLKYIKDYIDYISSGEVKSALKTIFDAGGNVELALSLAGEEERRLMLELIIERKDYPDIGWEELLESTLRRVAIESIRRELAQLAKEAPHDPIKKQRYNLLLRKLSILEGVKPKGEKINSRKKEKR